MYLNGSSLLKRFRFGLPMICEAIFRIFVAISAPLLANHQNCQMGDRRSKDPGTGFCELTLAARRE
jgi:hypothetical protein